MKRLCSTLVVLTLIVSIFSFMPIHAQAVESTEGYDHLKSDAERQAYAILNEGIASLSPIITIPEELDLYYSELCQVARAVCLDHPDYFWFLESWYYDYEKELHGKEKIMELRPSYFLDGVQISAGSQELLEAQIAFYKKVDQIISGIPVNLESEYDIALYLHDYLAQNIEYSLDGNHDSAYSALVGGRAACYGYSKAYQYLLNAVGIRARTITGLGYDANGEGSGHAWNQVWIDGNCYFTDVTWDDWEDVTIHAYFMLDLEIFSIDHQADSNFAFEKCDHFEDFYTRSAGRGVAQCTVGTTAAEIAENFKRLPDSKASKTTFVCEIKMHGDFTGWFKTIWDDLVAELGLSKWAVASYYYLDYHYYVFIEDSYFKDKAIPVESIQLNASDAVLQENGGQLQLLADITASGVYTSRLVYTSSDESVAVVDTEGLVTAVNPGQAVVTVSTADGSCQAECQISVTQKPNHQHTIRLMPESEPTCMLNGSASYYLCTTCGRRFADSQGQQEYTEASQHAIAADGHKDIQWQTDKNTHMQICGCGKTFGDTYALHEDADQNLRCDICNAPYKKVVTGSNSAAQKKESGHILPLVLCAVLAVGGVVTTIIIKKRR